MNIQAILEKKRITDDQLLDLIKPGQRIFFSSGPVMPATTIAGLIETSRKNLQDLEFIQIAPVDAIFSQKGTGQGKYRFKTFLMGESSDNWAVAGSIDVIPSTIAELPYLFVSGAVETDVAIIQVSTPDKKGNVSLGPVHDITKLVIENASLVIAEINPRVPVTHGDTCVPLKAFDHLIERDAPLLCSPPEEMDAVMIEIGRNVSHLIEDGATVSMGMGAMSGAIAAALGGKKNLSVCAHAVSDWIMDLVASGATSKKSAFNATGPISAAACIGSEKLYAYLDHNRAVAILPLLNSSYQNELSKIPRLTAIIHVDRIDLSADAVAIRSSDYPLDNFDSKLNFSLAAAGSRDGKSIVVLPSTDNMGQSNIHVGPPEGSVTIRSMRGSTRYVVTEYGIAALFGKTVRERAIAMIDIAHPQHRQALLQEAKEAGIIYPDQIYSVANALNYPSELEETKKFRGGLEILFRPIKISDEDMMRRLFYRVSEDAIFFRYLRSVRTMPHSTMQAYVHVDHIHTLSLVAVIQRRGIAQIIAEARFAYTQENDAHEIAFLVDEEFQGMGIGTYLVDRIIKIAQQRKLPRLIAYTHAENVKMARLFDNAAVLPSISGGVHEVEYLFCLDDAPAAQAQGGSM